MSRGGTFARDVERSGEGDGVADLSLRRVLMKACEGQLDRVFVTRLEVDDYIEKQKLPQKEICQKLRKIIVELFPDIKEEMKFGVPWYEGKYYIVALKDSVDLGFSLKGLLKRETELFEGGGKTMKHIKIRSLNEIDEKKIIKLMKVVKEKG